MSMRRKPAALLLTACLCVTAFLLCLVPVRAADDSHRISFYCATTDRKVIMEKETLNVFFVADRYGEISPEFKSVPRKADEAAYAADLAKHAKKEGIVSENTLTADANGCAKTSLAAGTYLITGSTVQKNGINYYAQPLFVRLEDSSGNETVCYMKYTSDEDKPNNQKNKDLNTGDNAKTTVYTTTLLVFLAIALAAGACIIRRRKDEA